MGDEGRIEVGQLKGQMDPRQALTRLLNGAGLAIASDDGRTITLRAAAPKQAMTSSTVARSAAGMVMVSLTGMSLGRMIWQASSNPAASPPCQSWILAFPPAAWMASVSSLRPGMNLSS